MLLILLFIFKLNATKLHETLKKTSETNCKDSHCVKCTDPSMCEACELGYGVDSDDDDVPTGRCIQCYVKKCADCSTDAFFCEECIDGYMFSLANMVAECIPCSDKNCKKCDNDNKICTECYSGYTVDISTNTCKQSSTPGGGNECKDSHCSDCSEDPNECLVCKDGYGFDYEGDDEDDEDFGLPTGPCQKCLVEHCQSCAFVIDVCNACEEGYRLTSNGPVPVCSPCKESNCAKCDTDESICTSCKAGYTLDQSTRKCVGGGAASECNVANCLQCESGKSDICETCKENYVVDRTFKCRPILYTIERPSQNKVHLGEPGYEVTAGEYKLETRKYQRYQKQHLEFAVVNGMKKITIDNPDKYNVTFLLNNDVKEVTFKVTSTFLISRFDIDCSEVTSDLTLNFDKNSYPSIINPPSHVIINGADGNNVDINKVFVPAGGLKITPNTKVIVNELNYDHPLSEFTYTKADEKNCQVRHIKVNQACLAKLGNAKVLGNVSIGLSATLNVNAKVNLFQSAVFLPFNDNYKQSLNDPAPLTGSFTHTIGAIHFEYRPENKLLESRKNVKSDKDKKEYYLIAQSDVKLDCGLWRMSMIKNKKYQFEDFYCIERDKMYIMYGERSDCKSNKMLYIIAIVVVVVVIAAIAGIAAFCIIRARKKNKQISDNEQDDMNRNMENPNYYNY